MLRATNPVFPSRGWRSIPELDRGEVPGRDAEGATEATGTGGMETPPKEL